MNFGQLAICSCTFVQDEMCDLILTSVIYRSKRKKKKDRLNDRVKMISKEGQDDRHDGKKEKMFYLHLVAVWNS